MERLKEETRWFLKNAGHLGYPFLRLYLRHYITEALKTYTEEEVNGIIESETRAVAGELGIDQWLV